MSDTEPLQTRLKQGLSEINLPLTIAQQQALLAYLALLNKWNQVYNLTAIRQLEQMLTYHLLDTLAVIPIIDHWYSQRYAHSVLAAPVGARACGNLATTSQPDGMYGSSEAIPGVQAADGVTQPAGQRSPSIRILDVGSGGGLPGIPWALARPAWQLSLIDCVQKKTAFLTQVKMQLNMPNLRVITGHVEQLPNYIADTQFDIIACRAFSSLEQLLTLTGAWLAPGGLVIALKGEYPTQELTALSDTWQVEAIHPITHISELKAQRHVVLISRSNEEQTRQG
jgi:16S rRNA (guanine527-N7)-methyltransferase